MLSTLSYPLLQLARERKWCEFVGSSPHEFKAQLRGQLTSARTSFNSLASAQDASELPESPRVDPVHAEQSPLLGEDVNGSANGDAKRHDTHIP